MRAAIRQPSDMVIQTFSISSISRSSVVAILRLRLASTAARIAFAPSR
jgi:hypothetical protein